MVAVDEPAACSAAWVAGDSLALLALLDVDCDGEVGLGFDVEVSDGVRDGDGAVGNGEGFASAREGDLAEGSGLDGGGAGRAVEGEGDGDGGDVEIGRGTAEFVGEGEADVGGGLGEVDGLADGGVGVDGVLAGLEQGMGQQESLDTRRKVCLMWKRNLQTAQAADYAVLPPEASKPRDRPIDCHHHGPEQHRRERGRGRGGNPGELPF